VDTISICIAKKGKRREITFTNPANAGTRDNPPLARSLVPKASNPSVQVVNGLVVVCPCADTQGVCLLVLAVIGRMLVECVALPGIYGQCYAPCIGRMKSNIRLVGGRGQQPKRGGEKGLVRKGPMQWP